MPVWLDLKHAAAAACLSVSTLRKYLTDSAHRLPAHLVGGKWLIAQDDLDRWITSFERAGERRDQLVEEIIRELSAKPAVRVRKP